jgi:hypothetical protein
MFTQRPAGQVLAVVNWHAARPERKERTVRKER